MDQPGKVANSARGQVNRENNIPLSPCVPENLVSRDGFSRPVPRQPAHLRTQAESDVYSRDSSRVPRRRPYMKPPYAIGSVPSLSGNAIAYRWRSLPRVRRHRASKPQDSSKRVLPWHITMDQSIFASLSHPHYWYEVAMLKVYGHHVQPTGHQPLWLPILLLIFSLSTFVPENLVSPNNFDRPVPRQPSRSPHSGWVWCLVMVLMGSSPSSRFSRRCPSIQSTVMGRFQVSRNCVPMAFIANSPQAQVK